MTKLKKELRKGFKKTARFGGGSLLLTIEASYNDIKTIFGKPNNEASDKVTHEWNLIKDGHIYTIYDWKQYTQQPKNRTIQYSIGGNNKLGAMELAQIIRDIK